MVRAIGRRTRIAEDVFHRVLVMPWWRFFAIVCALYLATHALFAGLYVAQPGSLAGARDGSF